VPKGTTPTNGRAAGGVRTRKGGDRCKKRCSPASAEDAAIVAARSQRENAAGQRSPANARDAAIAATRSRKGRTLQGSAASEVERQILQHSIPLPGPNARPARRQGRRENAAGQRSPANARGVAIVATRSQKGEHCKAAPPGWRQRRCHRRGRVAIGEHCSAAQPIQESTPRGRPADPG
jgi:hypothetical protein